MLVGPKTSGRQLPNGARSRTNKNVSACSRQPRRAASMAAMSIFFIVIIASKARFVTRVVGFGAMAGWLTAATHYGCDRTGPQVAKAEELFQEFGSIRFQSIERIRHAFLSERYCT